MKSSKLNAVLFSVQYFSLIWMCAKDFESFEDRKDMIFENMLHEGCDTKAAFQESFKLR